MDKTSTIKDSLGGNMFWDMTPSSFIEIHRRFGKAYRLYHQGRKESTVSKQARK
jgi:hypothetical protein